jgi:hypothetical protein
VTPERIEGMLRRSLGDPSLRLALWDASRDAYVDVAGRPIELPDGNGDVTVTPRELEGRNAAALIHGVAPDEASDVAEALATASLLLLAHITSVEDL